MNNDTLKKLILIFLTSTAIRSMSRFKRNAILSIIIFLLIIFITLDRNIASEKIDGIDLPRPKLHPLAY